MTEFKRWCVENGHTAASISEKTGISVHTIHAYMRGARYPRRETMKLFEEVYKVNAMYLFPV